MRKSDIARACHVSKINQSTLSAGENLEAIRELDTK